MSDSRDSFADYANIVRYQPALALSPDGRQVVYISNRTDAGLSG